MQNLSSTLNLRLSAKLGRLAKDGGHSNQRELLGELLISGAVPNLSEEVLRETDIVWGKEQSNRAPLLIAELLGSASPKLLPRGGTSVLVWRGDIRQLKVDAIVNAANSCVLLRCDGQSFSSLVSPLRRELVCVLTLHASYSIPTDKGWGALCPTTSVLII